MIELTDAARAAQRDYMREWRKKNKERVREKNRRYWERVASKQAKTGGAADAEMQRV